jgi:hypothetical protein
MADNYTQFSFELEKLTQEEASWLRNLLALEFEDDDQRKEIEEALGVPKVIRADIEYWPDFSLQAQRRGRTIDQKGAIWLYAADSGNPYNAALLVRAFLAKFRPKDIKLFSVAFTSSKPTLDGFGGETYVVTSKNIFSDAEVAGMIAKAIETGQQQKVSIGDLDIIIRHKNHRKRGG